MKLQGFLTDSGQETAINGKYLRRLVEIAVPFTEGAMKSLMESYIANRDTLGKISFLINI